MISFTIHNEGIDAVILLTDVKTKSSDRLRDFPKATQLISRITSIKT